MKHALGKGLITVVKPNMAAWQGNQYLAYD